MKVLILAAGYGTRLHAIAKDSPKPLLKIGDKPIVDHILDRLKVLEGLSEILLVTNDKFYANFVKWTDQKKTFPVPIKIVSDGTKSNEERLGSIGDIDFVLKKEKIQEELLIVGGDNLFDFNLKDYLHFARQHASSATIGLYDTGDLIGAKQFGVVEIDQAGLIKSFEEKPAQPKSTLVAMCFYYLPQKSLGLLSKYLLESKAADRAGDYIKWLSKNEKVYGFKFSGKWYDIGSIESYQQAQLSFGSST